MISAANLWKRFGDLWALRGLSFEVEQGSVFGLIGPNGASMILGGTLRAANGASTEKSQGTLEFLRCSTLSPRSILWGLVVGC